MTWQLHVLVFTFFVGTQRENERCMAELDKSKRRERLMEAELVKIYGDDWAVSLH